MGVHIIIIIIIIIKYCYYSTVQYSTVQYSTVQYSTVQYSTVIYETTSNIALVHCNGFISEASSFNLQLRVTEACSRVRYGRSAMGLETQSTSSIKSSGLISSGPQDLYTFKLTISFRTISAVTKRL